MQNLGIWTSITQTVVTSPSSPGTMLLQMFCLLFPAKLYSSSSTIDDSISERLVDPSNVSLISDQVLEGKSVFYSLKHRETDCSGFILVMSSLVLVSQIKMDSTTSNSWARQSKVDYPCLAEHLCTL